MHCKEFRFIYICVSRILSLSGALNVEFCERSKVKVINTKQKLFFLWKFILAAIREVKFPFEIESKIGWFFVFLRIEVSHV